MKKALMNASVASMIYKFNMDNIDILQDLGYQVDVACNFGKENPISEEEIAECRKMLKEKKVRVFETDCPRSIVAFSKMKKTYTQLERIIDTNHYDLIYTQSPIGGVICRLAANDARKKGSKVIYTAHGFHFYHGSPIINWIAFYPIEKIFSSFNDMLITINKEDYRLAKSRFRCQKVRYIPGVGVNIERFQNVSVSQADKRKELGIPDNAFVLLSVGELGARKNHQVVIDALSRIKDKSIYYMIAGKGELQQQYEQSAKAGGVKLMLLGSREDVPELCKAADVFIHPSVREGLGIAPLEAMASGLPLISSYVNGIKDYTKNGITGVCLQDPLDVDEMKRAISVLKNNPSLRKKCASNNPQVAEKFSLENSKRVMRKIFEEF